MRCGSAGTDTGFLGWFPRISAATTPPDRCLLPFARMLDVRGLRVALPDGRVLIDNIDLRIGAGEVVVLLGGSGAGKSTFARVLFEREQLDEDGFDVVAAQLDLDRGQLGL